MARQVRISSAISDTILSVSGSTELLYWVAHYFFDTMGQNRDAPTAEEVAEAAGGDVETARRALSAVRIRDETAE